MQGPCHRTPSDRLTSCLLNIMVTLQHLLTHGSDRHPASHPQFPALSSHGVDRQTSHVTPFSDRSRGGKLTHRRPSVPWPVPQVSLVGHCPLRHDSHHKSYSENFRIGKPRTSWLGSQEARSPCKGTESERSPAGLGFERFIPSLPCYFKTLWKL